MYKSEHIITSRHYLILVSLAFLSGVFFALSLGVGFAFVIALIILYLTVCLGFIIILAKNIALKKKYILLPAFLIIFFLAGILRVYSIDFSFGHSLKKYENQELWLYGTVTSEPQLTKSGYYHTFELDVFRAGDDTSVRDTVIVYLPSTHECDFHSSDDIYFWANLKKYPEGENVRSYEYYNFLRGKNIFLTASTKNINPLTDYTYFSLKSFIKQSGSFVRTKISKASEKLFPNDPEAASILNGILLGDKSGFSDKLYDRFSNSGISHIVSVSGLHVSILFSFLIVILGVLGINRKLLMFATIPFILIFMSASAFSPSVARASVMLIIMIFAFLLSEEYHPLSALFLAIFIIVAIAPYSILSKGLIMSFSATLGIFVYFPYFYGALLSPFSSHKWEKFKHLKLLRKPLAYFASSLSFSLSTLLSTAYFLVIFFGKISKVQLLTNLWVIPFVSIIFCLGYVACIFIYICPWLSIYVLKYPLMWCLKIIKYTITIFGDSRFAYIFPFDISSPAYAAVYFGGALMLYMLLKSIHDISEQKNHRS